MDMEVKALAEKIMATSFKNRIKNKESDKLEDLLKKSDEQFEDNNNGTSKNTTTSDSDVSGAEGGGATSENSEINNNAEKSGSDSDDEYESLPYDIEHHFETTNDKYGSLIASAEFKDKISINLKAKHISRQRQYRKMLLQIGLKKINDIKCVVIKKKPGILIIIENPEIYHNPNTDKYIILGGNTKVEAESVEDVHRIDAENINFANRSSTKYEKDVIVSELKRTSFEEIWKSFKIHFKNSKCDHKDKSNDDDDDDDDGDNNDDQVDEEKEINEENIKILMEHTNVSRRKAYQTLRKHDNDIVNAIIELTK